MAPSDTLGIYPKFTAKWLGCQDSNLGMPIPKTGALPLGDTPTERGTYRIDFWLATPKNNLCAYRAKISPPSRLKPL